MALIAKRRPERAGTFLLAARPHPCKPTRSLPPTGPRSHRHIESRPLMSPKPDRRPTAEASSRRPGHRLVGRASWLVAATLVFATVGPSAVHADTGARSTRVAQHILAIARGGKKENALSAVFLRVNMGRGPVAGGPLANSMTGTPATTDMHF